MLVEAACLDAYFDLAKCLCKNSFCSNIMEFFYLI